MEFITVDPKGVIELHNEKPTIELIQSLVGGYFEHIKVPQWPGMPGLIMYAAEDGKSKMLPLNKVASYIAANYNVVGTVVLFGPERRGNETSIPFEWSVRVLQLSKDLKAGII